MAIDLIDLGEFTGNEDEQNSYSPIDSGRYRAHVTGISREVGRSSGKPYLHWEFTLSEGQAFERRKIWDNTSLSDKAKWRIVALLKALGIDVPKGRLQLNPNDVLGRELILQIGQEPDDYRDPDGDEGIMRNTINGFAPVGGAVKPKVEVPASVPATKKRPKPKNVKSEEKPEPVKEQPPFDDDDDDFDFE